MKKIFERTKQGAGVGGILGAAIGTLIAAGATIAMAPISLPTACIVAGSALVINASTGGAIGTLVGGGVGAASGTVETISDHKKNKR